MISLARVVEQVCGIRWKYYIRFILCEIRVMSLDGDRLSKRAYIKPEAQPKERITVRVIWVITEFAWRIIKIFWFNWKDDSSKLNNETRDRWDFL